MPITATCDHLFSCTYSDVAFGDPKDERFLKEALECFLAYYRVRKLDHIHVYDGIKEELRFRVRRRWLDGPPTVWERLCRQTGDYPQMG